MTDFSDGPGRILPFDTAAADRAGRIQAFRSGRGTNIDLPDAMNGAIAVTRGLPLMTRNVRHSADRALTIINPWEES